MMDKPKNIDIPHEVNDDKELAVFSDAVVVHSDAGFVTFTFFQTVPTPKGDKPLKRTAVARIAIPDKLASNVVASLSQKFGVKNNG